MIPQFWDPASTAPQLGDTHRGANWCLDRFRTHRLWARQASDAERGLRLGSARPRACAGPRRRASASSPTKRFGPCTMSYDALHPTVDATQADCAAGSHGSP